MRGDFRYRAPQRNIPRLFAELRNLLKGPRNAQQLRPDPYFAMTEEAEGAIVITAADA